MRDIDAIKPLNFQYYATGVTPGHGDFMVKAVDVPVKVGGMSVMPGDMVHMDMHGAVKFPASKMGEVLERATKLLENESSLTRIYKARIHTKSGNRREGTKTMIELKK
jgi:regulator of RNase E activity RraA